MSNPGRTNLIAWWDLEEASGTRVDAHGSNDLTDENTVTSAAGIQGDGSSHVRANDEVLSLADNADVSMGDIDFTIGIWAKPTLDSQNMLPMSKSNVGNDYWLRLIGSSHLITFNVWNGGSKNISSSVTWTPDTWYFIVGRHDSVANTITIYVNGVVDSVAWTSGVADTTESFVLGGSTDNNWAFEGVLDSAFIYKRNLSDAELDWLYNSGAGRAYSDTDRPSPGAPGLKAWWSLDEESGQRDDSHGSNDLTDNNTVLFATGKRGNAGDFVSASSEYLSIADNDNVSVDGKDFTVFGWVKFDSLSGNSDIIGKYDGVSASGLEFLIRGTGTTLSFEIGGTSFLSVTRTITTGVWYFVCAWHDTTGNTFYLTINDGTADSATGQTILATSNPLQVGAVNTSNFLDGLMDEWGMYHRILTAAERTWLYNSGGGRSYSEANPPVNPSTTDLVAWWDMNETSGVRADSHGSNDLADPDGITYTASGKVGNAADLDGATKERFTSSSSLLDFGDEDFTIGAWVKMDAAASGNPMGIISKYAGNPNKQYVLQLENTGISFELIVSVSGLDSYTIAETTIGSPNTGTWYFVVAWHDSVKNEIGISVNARPADTLSHSGGVYQGSAGFEVGGIEITSFSRWFGLIDEGFAYGRVLSAEEIDWLYKLGVGRAYYEVNPTKPALTNLISWWELNETSGQQRDDSHGSNDLSDNDTVGDVVGIQGRAAQFTNPEHLNAASNSELQTGDIDFTVAIWYYHSVEAVHYLMSKGVEYILRVLSTSLQFATQNFSGNIGTPANSLALEAWHFVVVWHDATANTVNIQINNGTVYSGSDVIISTTTTDFYLSRYAGSRATASLDEVAFYKQVLSAGERSWLYNDGFGRTYFEALPPVVIASALVVAASGTSVPMVSLELLAAAIAAAASNTSTPMLSLELLAAASANADSLTPDTVAMDITLYASALILAASATPDTVDLEAIRFTAASVLAQSNTTDVSKLALEHAVGVLVVAASGTSTPVMLRELFGAARATADSLTSNPRLLRAIAVQVSAIANSLTSDPVLSGIILDAAAFIMAESETPDVKMDRLVESAASILAASDTNPDARLTRANDVSALVVASSNTSSPAILKSIAAEVLVIASSLTPTGSILGITLPTSARILAESETPNLVELVKLIAATTSIRAESSTNDAVKLVLEHAVSVQAQAASNTSTPAIGWDLFVSALVAANSATSDTPMLSLSRPTSASVNAASATGIPALLRSVQVSAAIAADSQTPDGVLMSREVSVAALAAAVSNTPDPALGILMLVAASAEAVSSTSDLVTLTISTFQGIVGVTVTVGTPGISGTAGLPTIDGSAGVPSISAGTETP